MNIQEAKIILQSSRPAGADANDPDVAAALELLRADPALQAWYARQQRFDLAMTSELEAAPVPADLRERILAAARPSAAVRTRSWWRGPAFIGLGLAAAAGVAVVLHRPDRRPLVPAAQSALAAFAVLDAQHPKTHGGHGDDAANLNRALNQPTTKLGDALPIDFHALLGTGCRTVEVEGRHVLEMCFRRNGVQFHCYIAQKSDFPQLSASPKPTVDDKGTAAIATWADAANLYVVVSKPGRVPLDKIL